MLVKYQSDAGGMESVWSWKGCGNMEFPESMFQDNGAMSWYYSCKLDKIPSSERLARA